MLSYPQLLDAWGKVIFEELYRLGVRHCVISPGSRSTPLTIAAARQNKIQTIIAHDERGAAFLALGTGKATGKPAVLVCTSGTAVANYMPAVIEAAMSEVPMMILSADRPPELHKSGANQTINQQGIFGSYIRFEEHLPVPDPTIPLSYLLTTLDHAYFRSIFPQAGPVHLNCMFRKPLEPQPVSEETIAGLVPERWYQSIVPYQTIHIPVFSPVRQDLEEFTEKIRQCQKPFVFIGTMGAAIRNIPPLKSLQLPFALDGSIAMEVESPYLLHYPDLALRVPAFSSRFQPDCWIQLGFRPTSGLVEKFLKTMMNRTYIHIHPSFSRSDPNSAVSDFYTVHPDQLELFLRRLSMIRPSTEWLEFIRKANEKIGETIHESLNAAPEFSEWRVIQALWKMIPEGMHVLLANSLTIRLVDMVCPKNRKLYLYSNRGASGIDGLIATAIGIAVGKKKPVLAILGDLAFHHDLNSLGLTRLKNVPPVIFVVFNNHGGGIFRLLPVAEEFGQFEEYFITPHPWDFRYIARHFGLKYRKLNHLRDLEESLPSILKAKHHFILEVEIDPEQSIKFYHRWMETLQSIAI